MTTRDKMKKDAKATLIHEWDFEGERFRLVARGKYNQGYEDEYIVEYLDADALGEPRWTPTAHKWDASKKDSIMNVLVGAIKSLIKNP